MSKTLFGSSEKYKMLDFLNEVVSNLERNRRVYLTTFVQQFHELIKGLETIQDARIRSYLCQLVHFDYFLRTSKMEGKYEKRIITYLQNYIKARIQNVNLVPIKEKK